MAEDKKVFDVAKPGSSKPDTGSKPMVVGHKIMKDPTITDSDNEQPEELAPQTNKITINPISHDDTAKQVTVDENVSEVEKDLPVEDGAVETTSHVEDTEPTDVVETAPEATEENQPAETAEQKQAAADVEQVEHEENLQKIIKEKTYNVPIEEASYSAFKTFVKTFLLVAIVGLLVVAVLIDAEIIDLGVDLPFDFL
jgi:hypothetical protein